MRVIDAARLERGRERAAKARATTDRCPYFHGVAQARYLLRKVFRLVEEEAKRAGIDPLAHQALIQIYGSETGALRVKEVARKWRNGWTSHPLSPRVWLNLSGPRDSLSGRATRPTAA